MEVRLWQEWNEMIGALSYPNVTVELRNNNIKTWKATIKGPQETPYSGGRFTMDVDFPEDYPRSRPIFKMVTPIFHVNVASYSKEICLSILRSSYNPENKVGYMISCIIFLLANPNPFNHYDQEARNLYLSDRNAYEERARSMTKQYAMT